MKQVALKLKKEIIANNFETIISDLFYLSRQNELSALFDNNTNEIKDAIFREYLEFSRFKNIYDQIRYLDEKGMEIVRVNHNNEQPVVVQNEKLQFKGDRYYFKDTFRLKGDEIFVSPFDLNIENERIEQPLKPMIRFGISVNDNGLFTATTIYPLQEGLKSSSGALAALGDSDNYLTPKEYYWKIISNIPIKTLKSGTRGLLIKLSIFAVFLFIISAVPSRFLAQTIVKKNYNTLVQV